MKEFRQIAGLFVLGGVGYAGLELLWRRKTHWSMALTGGCVLVALAELGRHLSGCAAHGRRLAGTACITTAELLVGLTVNERYGLSVWDYSHNKWNFRGQICAKYAVLWYLLSGPAMRVAEKSAVLLANSGKPAYNEHRQPARQRVYYADCAGYWE